MQKGRLDQLLREAGKTRDDIQNQPGLERDKTRLDRKTVITINKGEEVSLNTFNKLAHLLKCDVKDLITELSEKPKRLYFLEGSVANRLEVTARLVEPEDELLPVVWQCGKVLYNLDLPTNISPDVEANIRQLDVQLNGSEDDNPGESYFSSLSSQLTDLSKQKKVRDILSSLKENGIGVYIKPTRIWEKQDSFYNRAELEYSSTNQLLIGITEIHPKVTFIFDRGELSYEPSIKYLKQNAKRIFGEQGFDAVLINGTVYLEEDLEKYNEKGWLKEVPF